MMFRNCIFFWKHIAHYDGYEYFCFIESHLLCFFQRHILILAQFWPLNRSWAKSLYLTFIKLIIAKSGGIHSPRLPQFVARDTFRSHSCLPHEQILSLILVLVSVVFYFLHSHVCSSSWLAVMLFFHYACLCPATITGIEPGPVFLDGLNEFLDFLRGN